MRQLLVDSALCELAISPCACASIMCICSLCVLSPLCLRRLLDVQTTLNLNPKPLQKRS